MTEYELVLLCPCWAANSIGASTSVPWPPVGGVSGWSKWVVQSVGQSVLTGQPVGADRPVGQLILTSQ